jgi:hypothetical protein
MNTLQLQRKYGDSCGMSGDASAVAMRVSLPTFREQFHGYRQMTTTFTCRARWPRDGTGAFLKLNVVN